MEMGAKNLELNNCVCVCLCVEFNHCIRLLFCLFYKHLFTNITMLRESHNVLQPEITLLCNKTVKVTDVLRD